MQLYFPIHNIDRNDMWWKEDGACHTSNAANISLRAIFRKTRGKPCRGHHALLSAQCVNTNAFNCMLSRARTI